MSDHLGPGTALKTATRRPPWRDGVGAVTVRGSAVELFGDPGHRYQRECGGGDVDLQVAQPG
jgi:hypothetical protein